MRGGGDHGPAASVGVEEGAVEQLFSYSFVAVLLVYSEEGEHPYALAHERERHTGHPVIVHGDPGALGVMFQKVSVSLLAPLDLLCATAHHPLALFGGGR